MKDSWRQRSSRKLQGPQGKLEFWPLESKLQPAQYRVRLLTRIHLLGCLDNILKSALTIVRTPAGYGKTTLLSQWYHCLAEKKVAALWISLDEDDREATQFVSYLAGAASFKGANSRVLLQALHQSTQGMAPEEVVKSLIHEFEKLREPIILFLDDYHLIEGPENDQVMSLLLRCMPDNLHVVLATRTKPAFPLSTLRTTGKLQELMVEDLRFRDEEMLTFLGDLVAREDVDLLASRTEGWPVALQLACLWIKDEAEAHDLIKSFSGSTEEMAAYMVDQVMRQLPEATRDFLIQTSILDRINGDLANAVCGRDDCWRILDELERLNALIFPIDTAKTWYRHHHLFADFLRAQLERRGEVEIRQLHRRASKWFADKDQIYEAVKYACKAGDEEDALSLLDQAGLFYQMIRDGAELYKKCKLLFSPQALEPYPRVAVAQVLLWIKEGELQEGRILLENIKRKLATGHYSGARFDRLELGREILVMDCFLSNYLDAGVTEDQIAAMEAFAGSVDPDDHWCRAVLNNVICTMHFHHGNLINAMATAHASIEHFSVAGMDYGLFFINLHLGGFRLLHGNLLGSLKNFKEAQRIVDSYFPYDQNIRALSQVFMAEACYEQNRLEDAGEYIFDALQQVENADGWVEVILSGYRTALGLAFAKQKLKGIEPVLEMGRKFARKRNLVRLEFFLSMREVAYLTLAKETAEARRLFDLSRSKLEQLKATFGDAQIWREREDYQCTLARLLILEGAPEEALGILEPLAQVCEESQHIWRLIQTLILMSLAKRAMSDMDQASHHLRRALHYTRGDKILRIFLDEGQPVEELLKAVISHVGLAAISTTTLDWIAEILTAFTDTGADPEMTLINRVLTHREQDVLEYLKAGGSNKVIARKLDMTDNAVKFHLKNIYRKLGVNDRRLAISVAEKRGLLSEIRQQG